MSLFRWSRQLKLRVASLNYVTTATYSQRPLIWDETIEPKGQKVELKSRRGKFLTWYACGPTVYDSAHIGHASSYIRLDIIRRILEQHGYTILQVMGITDIDDKIIARSQMMNVDWKQLGQTYELEFFRDLHKFNVKAPDVKSRVSQFIPQIITFITELINSKFAYVAPNGTVYFDTRAYPHYGIFRQSASVEQLDQPETSSRVTFKRNPQDFALWKGVKPGEPYWDTPWGQGRPGWHIECSVIASNFFGPFLDIHSGGMDLTFPHHENEEAQCCAKFGHQKWVTHWIHTGHLHLTGDVKMSKSIGNTVSIEEFLKSNSPAVLRMICLMKKYQTNIEYSGETELHAKSLLHRLQTFMSDMRAVILGSKPMSLKSGQTETDLWEKLIIARTSIEKDLLNNFDTPSALLTVMELIGEFYRSVEVDSQHQGIDLGFALGILKTVEDFYNLVGFSQTEHKEATDTSSQLLEHLLKRSLEFRTTVRGIAMDKNTKKESNLQENQKKELMGACDEFRKNLSVLGIDIKDHAQSSSWSLSDKMMTSQNR